MTKSDDTAERRGAAPSSGKVPATRQRSFRMAAETLDRLDMLARERGESTNGLAERLVEEGLRLERHSLISFREGAAGRRPAIAGSRIDVWQAVEALRDNDDSFAEAGDYLGLTEVKVRAAFRYYAEFQDEVDEWAESVREVARREEEAFRREQALLA